ncbi:serine/threonine-protein kinase [Microbacterium maritypicum]
MTTSALPTGTTVNDRYVLQRKLGSDGDVYEAYDRHLDQTVALKLLHPTSQSAPQSWDEARRLEQLRSRFIIPVINADVVGTSDLRYIVTRLLPNGDLEGEARPYGLPTGLATRLGTQIASGIEAVHAAGMIHRDIKPANALLDGDVAHVSDFERCILLTSDGTAPRDGSWCTLAPEVADPTGECSVASDVYSLAATVFYLLSGEYPVDHRIPIAEQQQHLAAADLRSLAELAPHVPRAILAVVKRGMSVDPNGRYASPSEFGNALATAGAHRRSWQRIAPHTGHLYCAESVADRTRKALGVCAVPGAKNKVTIRSFYVASGRAVKGAADRSVRVVTLNAALRGMFAELG